MPDFDIDSLKKAVDAPAKLYSIFDRISNGSHTSAKAATNPLKERTLDGTNIVQELPVSKAGSFSRDLELFKVVHPEAKEETFGYLLQKYGWRIGTPDGSDRQDVAYCDAKRVEHALHLEGPNGYLLIKGDLSGIQDYIYGNIQQKTAGGLAKVAKRLRGRSIIVTLLSDFLASVVLKELGFSSFHLLFAGGGHFNLLLPNSPKVQAELADLMQKIDEAMRRNFGDRLQLIIAAIECTTEQLSQEAGRCFERLNAAREQKKYSQHQNNLMAHFYPESDVKNDDPDKRDEWEIPIGELFPKRQILIEVVTNGSFAAYNDPARLISLEIGKKSYTLLMEERFEGVEGRLNGIAGLISARVFTINSTDFMPEPGVWSGSVKEPVGFGFRFVGKSVPLAKYQQQKSNRIELRPQTFEEIARGLPDEEHESKAQKIPLEMLGAMRLDVDDLGYIFSHGLGSKATLGQLVCLSREIHYFFSAHFDQLARKFGLYLIYAGGDDAFVVGKWDKLIDFAAQLHLDFQSFTKGNPDIHFSAGLFLGDPRYPVGRFYHDAGDLQDAAKASSPDKDRVHIFNHPLPWAAYHKKIKFGVGIAEMLTPGNTGDNRRLTMAFAYKLLQLVKTSFHERTGIDEWGKAYRRGSLNTRRFARNVANMRYLFARNGFDKAAAEKVLAGVEKELITDFLHNFDLGDKGNLNAVRDNLVALNYALYTIRSQKNMTT